MWMHNGGIAEFEKVERKERERKRCLISEKKCRLSVNYKTFYLKNCTCLYRAIQIQNGHLPYF